MMHQEKNLLPVFVAVVLTLAAPAIQTAQSAGAAGQPGAQPAAAGTALTLDALRQAVAAVVPSRLPEFFQEIQDAFSQAGDEDSVFPIRHFYQRWGATIAIERRPSVAARLHAAERALADPDEDVRERAIQEAAEIVQAAYHEVAGG